MPLVTIVAQSSMFLLTVFFLPREAMLALCLLNVIVIIIIDIFKVA